MRDNMKLIALPTLLPGSEIVRITAPGELRRVAGFTFSYTGATIGERVNLLFGVVQTGTVIVCKSSRFYTANGSASFFLGATGDDESPASFTPASGVYAWANETLVTGPLPNLWFGPDLPMGIIATSLSGLVSITNVSMLMEIKKLVEAP